jgi:hypothetical protein
MKSSEYISSTINTCGMASFFQKSFKTFRRLLTGNSFTSEKSNCISFPNQDALTTKRSTIIGSSNHGPHPPSLLEFSPPTDHQPGRSRARKVMFRLRVCKCVSQLRRHEDSARQRNPRASATPLPYCPVTRSARLAPSKHADAWPHASCANGDDTHLHTQRLHTGSAPAVTPAGGLGFRGRAALPVGSRPAHLPWLVALPPRVALHPSARLPHLRRPGPPPLLHPHRAPLVPGRNLLRPRRSAPRLKRALRVQPPQQLLLNQATRPRRAVERDLTNDA